MFWESKQNKHVQLSLHDVDLSEFEPRIKSCRLTVTLQNVCYNIIYTNQLSTHLIKSVEIRHTQVHFNEYKTADEIRKSWRVRARGL